MEWQYVGEGGKHAVFRYVGKDIVRKGKLLRINKNVNGLPEATILAINERRLLLCRLLEPYVDRFETMELNDDLVLLLFLKTRESGVIPPCRRTDWDDSIAMISRLLHNTKNRLVGLRRSFVYTLRDSISY